MNLRVFHRRLAIIMSPFFLLVSTTGILLLFRGDGIYGKEIKKLIIKIHTWEIVAKYLAVFLGAGLMAVCITGLLLFLKNKKF